MFKRIIYSLFVFTACLGMVLITNPKSAKADVPGNCIGFLCPIDEEAHKPKATLIEGEDVTCCGRAWDLTGKKAPTPIPN